LKIIDSMLRSLFNYLKNKKDNCFGEKIGYLGKKSTISRMVEISNPRNLFIGNGVQIQQGVILRPGKRNKIEIGDESGINPYVVIYGKVKIGKWAMIAPNVVIAGGNHIMNELDKAMIKSGKSINKGVVIEDDVWLGASAVVLDGVRIGKGAVVGAGCIVTKDVAPYDIVVGNPAKTIGNRMKL